MLNQIRKVWAVMAIATVVGAGSMLVNAAPQKDSFPKPQDKLALGEDEVKRLLVIMGPDASGRISKTEFMKFMETEFERLDKNKNGELDVKNLVQPTLTASRFVGK
jgi:hypothetical protein